ncbi:MAG: PepSY domain-containing protein [Nitrospira sp.]
MYKGLLVVLTMSVLIAAAGTMILIAPASAEPNTFEKAGSAKVLIADAITTASEEISGAIIQAELEHKHDRLIWTVTVVTLERQVMAVHIDAKTGIVIDVEEEKGKSNRMRRRK